MGRGKHPVWDEYIVHGKNGRTSDVEFKHCNRQISAASAAHVLAHFTGCKKAGIARSQYECVCSHDGAPRQAVREHASVDPSEPAAIVPYQGKKTSDVSFADVFYEQAVAFNKVQSPAFK